MGSGKGSIKSHGRFEGFFGIFRTVEFHVFKLKSDLQCFFIDHVVYLDELGHAIKSEQDVCYIVERFSDQISKTSVIETRLKIPGLAYKRELKQKSPTLLASKEPYTQRWASKTLCASS